MLYNRPIQGLLPQINRAPINVDNDDMKSEALEGYQNKYNKDSVFSIGSTVAVQ